jgi:hypothetical protein
VATIVVAWHRGAMPVVQQLGFWLVLNLVFTFSATGVSVGGHLGGLVGGALTAALVIGAERKLASRKTLGGELAVLTAIGIVSFVAALAIANARDFQQSDLPVRQADEPAPQRVAELPREPSGPGPGG